ncbi:unnamed protein product, partial [Brenthis ino]
MLIRTVWRGVTWIARRPVSSRGVRARAVDARAGLAPCGSAVPRPSGGRALVRSRLCAPFALHCKYFIYVTYYQ